MRWSALVALAFLATASAAWAQTTADEIEIRRTRSESNRAIARHDVAGILASLEAEVVVSASNGAFVEGREAMGRAFAARFAEFEDATYVRTPESVVVSTAGPIASETGSWVGGWTTSEGALRTGGRYMAYWRKSDDVWLIHAEVYVPLFCEGPGCP